MEEIISTLPAWLPAYWVGVTVFRLALLIVVLYGIDRTANGQSSFIGRARWVPAAALTLWVAAAIYLGSRNFFRIHEHVSLPPPIAAGALVPILVGFLAFQYWEPFRRLIFRLPQH